MDLKLNDESVVKLDTKLNIKKLMMINKDFNTDKFAKMSIGSDESMDINVFQGLEAVYVAYRQANMNSYLPFDEFMDKWDFDMEIATTVYSSLLFTKARNAYADAFKKSTLGKK